MKFLVIFSLVIFAVSSSFAVTLTVTGKNNVPVLKSDQEITIPSNVGRATVQILQANNIEFTGSEEAFSSINHQDQEMVMVSDTETKAYGWCFSLDGIEPSTMPNETPVIKQDSKIEWYYGYAHYKDGAWIAQCRRD